MPKLRHYDHLNTARFITFSCYCRHKLLVRSEVIGLFLQTLQTIREEYGVRLFGYVIMPEHVHLVLHPPDTLKLGPVVGELKSQSASKIISQRLVRLPVDCYITKDGHDRLAFWQPRCYDHNCRSPETVIEKIRYSHNNPVKRGLVGEPGLWRWSSYNWYAGKADQPLEMDEFEGKLIA